MTIRSRDGGKRIAMLLAAPASLAIVAVMAGCSPNQLTTTPSSTPAASASPSASTPSATAAAGVASPSTPGESAPLLPAGVSVDSGLLEVLPVEIDGVALEPDPTTADEVARNPLLAESALSIAVALAVARGASDSEDLAVANVIRLRPDVFDETFYQEWRDGYNEAACDVAGGVASERQAEIGGHQTYIGSCVGGAETYHTYLEDQGFLVSVTATGEGRFGELIIAGLAR